MADEVKIVPSPPPAEPTDVRVSPSPAPAEPFDVPTNPSPPPSEPFDVKVYPDPPPGGTVDVPTSPDGPPVEPYDVPTSPDGPPVAPFDVPTLPDGPPIEPIDVPTLPDLGPVDPFDVPTLPDGPPVEPIDVATTPDGPPIGTFDVPITLDVRPTIPLKAESDVDLGNPIGDGVFEPRGIVESVPAPTVHVRDHRNLGVPALVYPLLPNPSFRELIRVVKQFDGELASFLNSIVHFDKPHVTVVGGGALDPRVLAGWFRDYTSTVGQQGVAKFIAEQATLYAMNPVTARIFDPSYFFKMMVPFSMGHAHTTLDTQLGLTAKFVAEVRDDLLQAEVSLRPGFFLTTNRNNAEFTAETEAHAQDGEFVASSFAMDLDSDANAYGPGRTSKDGVDFSVGEMVDAIIDNKSHPFLRPDPEVGSGIKPAKRFDATKYFDEPKNGASSVSSAVRTRVGERQSVESREGSFLAASTFINGVVRAAISPYEDPDGCVYSRSQDPSNIVDDDDARVPVSFTDLRKTSRGYRTVYVRPLNLSFSKNIAPEWSEASAFGRVDPIVGYQRTTKTYSVSFDMQAFAPEDLVVMYRKMVWIDSMCYPSYGEDSLMKSGPVIRMRIGDAVSTDNGGLTGIIKSLSFDFAEAMWELKKGMKVPMSFKATLEFLTLHDGPVGRLNDDFGVFQLPPTYKRAETDTTESGAPAQPREGPQQIATLLPGRYARFGDPRR
jgi:hypothetical protein